MKKEPNLSRRILIYAVMTFCMTMLTWLAWNGRDNSDIHKLLAEGCFYLMGFVTFFYVLGGNVDKVVDALPILRGGIVTSAPAASSGQMSRQRPQEVSHAGSAPRKIY